MNRENISQSVLEYLKIIQNVIDRMARCSFWIKGWCITLITAILAFSVKGSNPSYATIGFLPVFVFWFLDSYYLRQERLYQVLYKNVISELDLDPTSRTILLFDMNTKRFEKDVASHWGVAWSRTIWPLYVLMSAILLVIWISSYGWSICSCF